MKKAGLFILLLIGVVACSQISKRKADKALADFQASLTTSDEEILKQFVGKQEREAILKAIRILQNKDTSVVKSRMLSGEAAFNWEDEQSLEIKIPVQLITRQWGIDNNSFSIHLFINDGQLKIEKIDANDLYERFYSLKYDAQNAEAIAAMTAQRKPYYDRAKEIQKNYDSVIWYVNQDTSTYFYVVNGKYNFDSLRKESATNFKMGLVDFQGKEIVPVKFDLVFRPEATLPHTVEVREKNKIGFYSLDGEEILPAVYDWLIPYREGNCIGLVMKDSTNGWIDKDFKLHEDFPTKQAEQYVTEFEYLTKSKFSYGTDQGGLINAILQTGVYAEPGIVVAPTYLVKLGLLPQVTGNFVTFRQNAFLQYGNDLLEAKVEQPSSFSGILSGFVAEVQRRFIGGRSEFYDVQKVVLTDGGKKILGSFEFGPGVNLNFKKINDTLFQYSYLPTSEYEEMIIDFPDREVPYYEYFSLKDKRVKPVSNQRRFGFTKLFKLDSSFLVGNYRVWDPKSEKEVPSNFLSKEALTQMREEILAEYGFAFKDKESKQWLSYAKWYKPTTDSYDEVYARASEIDKYNLDFLAKLIGPYNSKPV